MCTEALDTTILKEYSKSYLIREFAAIKEGYGNFKKLVITTLASARVAILNNNQCDGPHT